MIAFGERQMKRRLVSVSSIVFIVYGLFCLLDTSLGAAGKARTGILLITTVDSDEALISAPVTVKRRKRTLAEGSGTLKVDLSLRRHIERSLGIWWAIHSRTRSPE